MITGDARNIEVSCRLAGISPIEQFGAEATEHRDTIS
jgi:hypothetical protein